MEENKYGKIINGKLYRANKYIKENGMTYSNPTQSQLEQFGYKKIISTMTDDTIAEDGNTIYTNKCFYELKHITESPINKLIVIKESFTNVVNTVKGEINANTSKYEYYYDEFLKNHNFICCNKDFRNFIFWLEKEYGKEWFKTFDIDKFLKNGEIYTNEFFNKSNIPIWMRLPIVAGSGNLQSVQKEKEKNTVLTSLFIFVYTKFDSFVTKIVQIFLEEYKSLTLKKELSRLSIEEKMQILEERVVFDYKIFLPILCRRNSIIHDDGILSEWRYNKFKEKCTLPFQLGENITPSVDDVLKEIEIMINLLEEICKIAIEDLKSR